ncbi:UDP-glucose 4-epimerase [Fontibacillus phaseoli]|uniref:UDP-glucose 4-epimerase n=1 Tax=Fontibacillus phaseoli TaxID=1416533 RepID=A0A369BH36_9BACL|nr:NAD-dependent epimerase/dehydratase family protein [Fontibacillus phaseoli]RCX19787.1 UDP-glucose 4-epimerase [Fontibacillus phaseoli]
MKTVVVTGGAGFIGSHLVNRLVRQNMQVHVIDNLSTGRMENVPLQATLHIEDVRSEHARNIIMDAKPDTLIHLAAQADVQQSVADPFFDMQVNVSGTLNMLEACRMSNVRKFIFASTSGVYGDLQKEVLTELDPVKPISFYALSKMTAEHYIRMYDKFYNIPYTILRFANVYGPGQTVKGEGGVISIFMDKVSNNLSLPVNGDGEQTRDFVYVKDVGEAIVAAVDHGNRDTIHVSTGIKTSLNQLIGLLASLHPKQVDVVYQPPRPGDIMHSCLSNLKARNHLHWKPVYSIQQGLAETYRYGQAN